MTDFEYHAHIYYATPEEQQRALVLRAELEALFPKAKMGQFHTRPVAFHSEPMFQVEVGGGDLGKLISWLMLNRRQLSILVHPFTGDLWLEHTEQALWLGPAIALNRGKLRQLSLSD